MLISIVTPCYNSAEFIEKCILSVKNQNAQNFEHIIVDGGSTDATVDIIRRYEGTYNMRWISEKDNGMYDAIAKGFRMAKGEVFAYLNSDDMYVPWTTQVVERAFSTPHIRWCTGFPAYYDEAGCQYFMRKAAPVFPQYIIRKGWCDGRRASVIQQESTFWSRELYEKAGGINPKYKSAGDYNLWVAFAQHEKLYTINAVLSGFRIHTGQKSGDVAAYQRELPAMGPWQRFLKAAGWYKHVTRLLSCRLKRVDVRRLPR